MKEFLTVSALTKYIRLKFDKDRYLKDVPLSAEIAEINCRRGNYYLRLKDEQAIISGVIFAQYETDVIKQLNKGEEVKVIGDISVYEKTGAYQIYIRSVELGGKGDIYQTFERLKKKLQEAGYFDIQHKKALPTFPKKIALVTAPHSAALHDMIITTKNRYPLAELIIFETAVQGEKAVTEIIKQLKQADVAHADVVVLARGGGSYEDLLVFNDEQVAMQIFQMQTPIITGIGHEIDVTIADLVADVRAATPTAAIEQATPDKAELQNMLVSSKARFQRLFMQMLATQRKTIIHQIERLSSKSPANLLKNERLRLEQSVAKLHSPFIKQQIIEKRQQEVAMKKARLLELMAQTLTTQKETLKQKQTLLAALSPFEVLIRGYAIAQKGKHVIKTIHDVVEQDDIAVLVSDGQIKCKVIATEKA